jgi:hypothetical protein
MLRRPAAAAGIGELARAKQALRERGPARQRALHPLDLEQIQTDSA